MDLSCKKISKTLRIMSKIKKELPLNALLNIYNTLILPRLNYGLMEWGWKSNRIITLQKRESTYHDQEPF